jgi:hypothetical protein
MDAIIEQNIRCSIKVAFDVSYTDVDVGPPETDTRLWRRNPDTSPVQSPALPDNNNPAMIPAINGIT